MELKYCQSLTEPQDAQGVWELLVEYGDSFVPPLSQRASTRQRMLEPGEAPSREEGPRAYFQSMQAQPFLLAKEGERVEGFLTFCYDYIPPVLSHLDRPGLLGLYVSTIIVSENVRRRGVARSMYEKLATLEQERERLVSTRTWSENAGHIALLGKLGFSGPLRIPNDRGPGIDTVYYHKFLGKGEGL